VGAALGPTRYELRIAVPDELVAYVDARVASLR
jgi:hypothetical protein